LLASYHIQTLYKKTELFFRFQEFDVFLLQELNGFDKNSLVVRKNYSYSTYSGVKTYNDIKSKQEKFKESDKKKNSG
jgi:hypothetical protein